MPNLLGLKAETGADGRFSLDWGTTLGSVESIWHGQPEAMCGVDARFGPGGAKRAVDARFWQVLGGPGAADPQEGIPGRIRASITRLITPKSLPCACEV